MNDVSSKWVMDASDELALRNGCWFDVESGAFAVWWIERYCRLYEGEWAGDPMHLRGRHDEPHGYWPIAARFDAESARERAEHFIDGYQSGVPCDWQYLAIMRLFGWMRHSAKWNRAIRRFRSGSLWVPKKNKKSPTLAAIGLYLTCGDSESGQKVAFAAKDGSQARDIAGKHAIEMCKASPELMSVCKINMNEMQIEHVPSRSFMKPFSSSNSRNQQAKEGFNGSILVDETHVVDRAFMKRLSRAGISRSEPMQLEVSTAGNNPDGYGKERFDYGADVANGKVENDQLCYLAYAAPQDVVHSEWSEQDVIRFGKIANPAWGHTIDETEYLSDWSQSKGKLGDALDFLMYRLNVWQKSSNPWLRSGDWAGCMRDFTEADMLGRQCLVGFDKSQTRDFSAFVCLFPEYGEHGIEGAYILPYIVAPAEYIRKHANDAPFMQWVREGYLQESDGDIISVGHLYSLFGEINEKFNVIALGYDPYRSEELTQLIEQGAQGTRQERISNGYGVKRVPVGQSSSHMIESIGEFEAMVKEGKIWHNGHPVLSWMIDNVHVKVVNGSTRIAKVDPYSYRKVDAVAAALDAFCLARVPEYRPQRSVYEERGVLMI